MKKNFTLILKFNSKNNIELITEENAFVHVSGHPNREDLKDILFCVKPQSIKNSSW